MCTIRRAGELEPGDRIFRWKDGKRLTVIVRATTYTGKHDKVFNLILSDSEIFIAGGFLARSKPPVTAVASLLEPPQLGRAPFQD